jgi:hypothetical protein
MKNIYHIILENLKNSDEFRLINAKDKVLDYVIYSLCGYTTDIEDYLYVFDEIEKSFSFVEELENNLTTFNNELKNKDDFNVPLTIVIEELCQEIRGLGPFEDTQSSIWSEEFKIDELFSSERCSFEEIINKFTDYIRYNEKAIFRKIISYYKQNEKKKEILIEQLDTELKRIKTLAENLLKNEEVEKNWGSQLQEICHTQAYSNNLYSLFNKEKEDILLKNSIGLNELEKLELNVFFNELEIELG